MPVGRPSKFSRCEQAILRALRNGSTRTAAANAAGVAQETLRVWLLNKVEFSAAVTRAEAACENVMAAAVKKAAAGYKVTKVTTRKTILEGVDGEAVPAEVVETVVTTEFDWRAGEAWLKRRSRQEWGDSLSVALLQKTAKEVQAMTDAELLALFGPTDGDPDAVRAGGSDPPRPADPDAAPPDPG